MNLIDFEQPRPARDVLPTFWTDHAAIKLVQQWCDDGLLRELDADVPSVRLGVLVLTESGRNEAGLPPLVPVVERRQRELF